jgi:hypothetical protein
MSIGTALETSVSADEMMRGEGASIQRFSGVPCGELIRNRRDGWLRALKSAAGGSVDLHPDLLAQTCGDALLVLSSAGADGGEMKYAALAGQRIRMRVLIKPDLRLGLAGHRVIGNEIIGCTTPQDRGPFVEAMFDLVDRRESDCIMLDDLEIGSAMYQAVVSAAASDRRIMLHQPSGSQARWWIDFDADPAEYWKKFSKKTRETFRNKARKLEHTLLKFTSADDVAGFLKLAREVSQTSWQTKRMGLRISDTPETQQYWRTVAEIGAFRSYVLQQGERPIAFMVGRQWEGKFYYEEAGYDLEFSKQSPGTVLQIRVMEDLIEHDTPRVFDFSFGDGEHKRMFGNRKTDNAAFLLLRRSWRNSAVVGLQRAAAGVAGRLRSSRLYRHLRQSQRR